MEKKTLQAKTTVQVNAWKLKSSIRYNQDIKQVRTVEFIER